MVGVEHVCEVLAKRAVPQCPGAPCGGGLQGRQVQQELALEAERGGSEVMQKGPEERMVYLHWTPPAGVGGVAGEDDLTH